jgi:hypothetical protein
VQGESREDSAPGSWYTDVFPGFIEQCRDLILEEAGVESVVGLILAGSFASSEGSIVLLGGRPLFLSDIDLLLVVSSSASHARLYPRRSKIGKACEGLLPGAVFEGRIDVGVMTSDELAAMPPSPGVFDMREVGLLLHGEEGLRDRFPSFGRSEIGTGEALRLLENRMAAFLGDRPGTDRPEGRVLYSFLYGVSRVYTDIVTASMCVGGIYRSGYRARAEFLSSPESSEMRGELGDSLSDDAVRWTRFKTEPDADKIWTGEDRASRVWLDAAGDLLAVRDGIMRKDGGCGGGTRHRPLDLLRLWKRAAADRRGIGRLRLLAEGPLSGREPLEQIREASVRLIMHAVGKGTGSDIGAAPGGYPHGRGSWEDAASRTAYEWRRLVTGREDDSLE